MSQNPRGYTFSGLLPNTNYSLSISAQNLEGEGSAATISFVTPQSSISNGKFLNIQDESPNITQFLPVFIRYFKKT